MKSLNYFISFLLIVIAEFSAGQINEIMAKEGICDTLKSLDELEKIEFVNYHDFFIRIAQQCNHEPHWKLFEAGLIYDNKEDLDSDIVSWRNYFGCNNEYKNTTQTIDYLPKIPTEYIEMDIFCIQNEQVVSYQFFHKYKLNSKNEKLYLGKDVHLRKDNTLLETVRFYSQSNTNVTCEYSADGFLLKMQTCYQDENCAIMTFHPNGKLNMVCQIDQNENLVGWKLVYDQLGNLIEKKYFLNNE